MLPHAAHARQVVLELRELDLELPLGADVRAGRRCRGSAASGRSRACSSAFSRKRCCAGSSSSSTSRLSASASLEALLQLLELALADVRALRRAGAVLHDARRPARRRPCARAPRPRRARRRRRPPEPAPRGRTRARAPGNVESSRGDYARCRPEPDLAAADARARRHPVGVARARRRCTDYVTRARAARARVYDDGESLLYAKRDAASRSSLLAGPHRHRAGAGQPARAGSRTAPSIGLGASDMKGGLAVMIELARWAAERRARLRPRAALLPARGARAGREPAARRLRATPARRRGGARRSASSRPTTRSSSAASATSTRASSSRAARRTRRGRGSA